MIKAIQTITIVTLIGLLSSCANTEYKKDQFISGLVNQMTVDEKVGQMI